MAEQTDFSKILGHYYPALQQGDSQEWAVNRGKRGRAVAAALSIIQSRALAGTSDLKDLREEIGPLADAIQSAMDNVES